MRMMSKQSEIAVVGYHRYEITLFAVTKSSPFTSAMLDVVCSFVKCASLLSAL